MFERIMVPVDGSVFAEQAVPLALRIATWVGAEVRLVMVHALIPAPELRHAVAGAEYPMTLPVAEQVYLSDIARRIRSATAVEVGTTLLTGQPVKALYTYVRRHEVGLVVMSTHGRGPVRRAWLGSVADGLLRRLPVPVLLVRPDEGRPAELRAAEVRRVLVAVDGSAAAEAALTTAADLCARLGACVTLVRVVLPASALMPIRVFEPALDVHYTLAAQRDAEVYLARWSGRFTPSADTRVVVHEHPATAILDQANAVGADLIVIGTRGHGSVARLVLGSVADKIVRASALPVLACPSPSPVLRRRERQDEARSTPAAANA